MDIVPQRGGPLEGLWRPHASSSEPTLETLLHLLLMWTGRPPLEGLSHGLLDVFGGPFCIILLFCLEDVPFPPYIRGFRHFDVLF